MNDSYVYTYTVPGEDKPFYVGMGRRNRFRHHLHPSRLYKYDTHFYCKLRELLSRDIQPEIAIVKQGLTADEANAFERELISLYGRRDLGTGCLTNHSAGGEGTWDPGPTTRKKMSEKAKAHFADGANRRRVSESLRGKSHSVATKQKMSNSRTGRKWSPTSRRKLSESARQRYATEEGRNALGKPVESYDPVTGETVKRYPRIKAVVSDGFHQTSVSHVLGGRQRTHKQLGWRYTCNISADTDTTPKPSSGF